jgi:HD-like signal output (HDOD) protein
MMTYSEQTTPAVDELLLKTILDIGIPPRPMILDVLAREVRAGEPNFKTIAQHVSEDVSLAAGLIKTANSPFFGFRIRAKTVAHALTMLGIDVSTKAIAGIALRNAFPVTPALERFWDSSARVAEFSGHLVEIVGSRDHVHADDAYTFGLFRDCGIPVLLRKFPFYKETLARANTDKERRFTTVEEEDLPTNHAIIGCMLAQSWSLPEEICLAIRHHHDFLLMQTGASGLPSASQRLIGIAQLAEHLYQMHTGMSYTQEWLKLGRACMQVLKIEEADLEAMLDQILAKIAED